MKKDFSVLESMGQRIVDKRKQLGWSQEQLAEKADISVQMLSTAERGAKGMHPINLLKISEALGVSADYLLKGSYTDKDTDLMQDKLMKLPTKDRNKLEALIDAYLNSCEDE